MRIDENGNTYIKSEAQFTFELKGESYIEASTLSKILDDTVEVVNQIVQGEPDTFVNLKITKFSTGSFDIYFQAIAEQLKNIVNDPETVAAGIVASVSGAFGLVKHLKGKKPKEIKGKGKKAKIVNEEGDVFVVDKSISEKYFENAKIENSIINIVNTVKEDTKRPGFKVKSNSDENENIVEYTRQDFEKVNPVVEKMIEEKQKTLINEVDATLIIRKPDLIGDSKWGFIYNTYIDASIEDKKWLEKIRKENVKFGKNMMLPVRMRIETKLSKDGCITNDTVYTIIKVTGKIIEDNQETQTTIKNL